MKKARSILVFCTQHMPTGGIESHLLEFCSRMSASGVQIDLVITNSEMMPETEKIYRQVCRKVYLGKQKGSLARMRWLLTTGLLVSATRYAALYTNGQGESITIFEKFVRHGGRWVHHHHTAGDAADRLSWGKGYLAVMKAASTIIACSGKNARDLAAALQREVEAVPCFSRDLASETKRTAPGVLKIGYYGRLIPEKGIETLCRFSEEPEFSEIEIHLWGEGAAFPPTYFLQYPKAQFHGAFFGKEALANIVNDLDAYLLLSTHPEGLPIALLEVMSAGVPWLATDKGGVSDIACDPLATRVIPATATYLEMKAAVLALVADLRSGRIDRSVQKALYARNFSAEVLVGRWREIFNLNDA